MASDWGFLTTHARVLLAIANDPASRLREIAAAIGISERRAFDIVTDLVDAGYVVKEREGRRSRYEVQAHLPLAEPLAQPRPIGDILALLAQATDQTPTPAAG